jgi:hypothetical protein
MTLSLTGKIIFTFYRLFIWWHIGFSFGLSSCRRDSGMLWLLDAHGSRWSLRISCARLVGGTLGGFVDEFSFLSWFLSFG